jgi:NAD(P)-dependent dehydrogenase (short-subunit alcohol dehydrogenase family)
MKPQTPSSSPLALVVGGTGMLAGVVRGLVDAGCRTAVVARNASRITGVAAGTRDPERVLAVPADYTRPDSLKAALDSALASGERFATVVLWVHGPHRPAVREVVSGLLAPDALLVDVLGSSALDPSRERPLVPPPLPGSGVTYRAVVLGFTEGPYGSRWLTHQEISDGVLAAVADGDRGPDTRVVGRVEPWANRP